MCTLISAQMTVLLELSLVVLVLNSSLVPPPRFLASRRWTGRPRHVGRLAGILFLAYQYFRSIFTPPTERRTASPVPHEIKIHVIPLQSLHKDPHNDTQHSLVMSGIPPVASRYVLVLPSTEDKKVAAIKYLGILSLFTMRPTRYYIALLDFAKQSNLSRRLRFPFSIPKASED